MAKSILELTESGLTSAPLEELAVPFARELCAHIAELDTKSTSAGSRLLDACRRYFDATTIAHDEPIVMSASLAFNNVIDAVVC